MLDGQLAVRNLHVDILILHREGALGSALGFPRAVGAFAEQDERALAVFVEHQVDIKAKRAQLLDVAGARDLAAVFHFVEVPRADPSGLYVCTA